MRVKLIGRATSSATGRRSRRSRVRRPPPPAGRGRGRLQRGDAAGRRDPRDHARRPGRRRDRDRVGRRRRHGLRRRHDRNGLPPERPRLANLDGCPPGDAGLAALSPARGRGPRRRSGANRAGALRRGRLGRPARAAAADGHAVLHVVTHEASAGHVDAALDAIRALPEARGEASAMPVVSGRGVAELGWA